ncbi:MAG: hypothetical protein M0Z49_04645, partial [Chloroflexi bacterium]|nr:hypothetical protein [Chloroflexota bacterium]
PDAPRPPMQRGRDADGTFGASAAPARRGRRAYTSRSAHLSGRAVRVATARTYSIVYPEDADA